MKKLVLSVFLVSMFSFSIFAQAGADNQADIDAVKKVIQSAYVEGLQNEGNFEKIDNGFHPAFELLGIGKGDDMWEYHIYSWKESVKRDIAEGKKPKKDEEKVSIKFLSVDVTGTAAVAKIEFYVGEKLTYVDYLSLYKFESGWKIVSKIFYKFPEEKK